MIRLAENRYGKSRVRLIKVKRQPGRHELYEWTVEVLLEGDFGSCFIEGDNSKILPTDTMKNTVYSLARNSTTGCIEEFGQELTDFLLARNSQVTTARLKITEKGWDHLKTGGAPHPTTFVLSSREAQITEILREQGRTSAVVSGFDNLVILKTAGSEFVGFLKDSLTTLPESTDRLLGTSLCAKWKYASTGVNFASLRSKIRETLLGVFAAHNSKSVQHTLYAMGEAVLGSVLEIDDIELTMPNIHCLLVDLSRFGQDNPNQIFVPIDEPHGYIEARLSRRG
jgi:urate oxidase